MKKFIMTIICFMFLIPSVLLAEELTKGKKDLISCSIRTAPCISSGKTNHKINVSNKEVSGK